MKPQTDSQSAPSTQRSAIKSITLVLIQFSSIALIFLTGPLFAPSLPLLLLEFAGLALGVWAILAQGLGNFSITPDPVSGAQLVTRGPYKMIRHPMYSALLITTLPLVVSDFSFLRLAIWLILLADLVVKLNYEEGLLAKQFSGYASYRLQTHRLLPFIY